MTNRALPLEIRGLSRGSFDGLHPLPEGPEESVPLSYLDTVWELKGLTNSYCTPDTSSRSSPTSDNTIGINNIFSLSNSWSTYTGNLTGRSSSAYSWGNDDEFDRQAAATVKRMFDEIDEKLFEGKPFNGSDQLLSECEEWCSRFPHLRISGVQTVPAKDDGTQVVPPPPDDPRACGQRPPTSFLEDVEDNMVLESQGLFIQGVHVQPFPVELSASCVLQGEDGNEYREFEEEVFAENGQVEEYFAYDSPGPDDGPRDEAKRIRARLRRHVKLGLPPLTPNACARDAIASEMFDQIWSEVVVWLRNLLSLHSQKLLRDKPHLRETVRPRDRVTESPPRPMSRPLPPQLHRGQSVLCVKGLEEMMMIKPFPLQPRAPSVATTQMIDRAETPFTPAARPVSSSTVVARSRRFASAKKNKNSVRLPPLDMPKTPNDNVYKAIVQGTKLTTGNERLSSPPHPGHSNSPQSWARNGTLLPLDSYQESLVNPYQPRTSAKTKVHFKPQHRASSAATDDSRRSLREKTTIISDTRPNTTHTFRTDLPIHSRRLSIPPNGLSSRGLVTGRQPLDLMAGVTGVSMMINNPLVETQASHSSSNLQSHDTRGISPASDETDDLEIEYDHNHQTHPPHRRTRLGASIR